MPLDYSQVESVSEEAFLHNAIPQTDLDNPALFTKTDRAEVRKIERLLDILEGTLQIEACPYYFERVECETCKRLLTAYDFVLTGLVDAGHTKSLILHTLVGNKLVVNKPRVVRCSACGTKTRGHYRYWMGCNYTCSGQVIEAPQASRN